jgi:hypothetical protein
VLLAAVCKSPGHAWNYADVIDVLSFKHELLLAKHPFWNSVISNISGAKLLNLQHINRFGISAPKCLIHYSPAGNGDVLDIVVYRWQK